MAKKCSICSIFQQHALVIENLANEPRSAEFPEAFEKLIALEMKQNEPAGDSAMQCPECGLVYEYSRCTPGGSNDAMQTFIVEKLEPMMKHGSHLRKNVLQKQKPVEFTPEFKCPACGCEDIECVDAGNIYGEVFITLKCTKCGCEDTLDEYQLMNWRHPDFHG